MVMNHVIPMTIACVLATHYCIEVYIFGLGLSPFSCQALFVKYRDVQYIWEAFHPGRVLSDAYSVPADADSQRVVPETNFYEPAWHRLSRTRATAVISHDKAIITTWRVFDHNTWYALIYSFAVVHRGCRCTGGLAYFPKSTEQLCGEPIRWRKHKGPPRRC
jgi:hypothetical protein